MNAAPEAVTQARLMLTPGRYCILDVETTDLDGSIVEIAVIAADSGETLFDELIDPAGIPISEEAASVHGLAAIDLVGARQWSQVYPDLAAAIGERHVAAYNYRFDLGRIVHDCKRSGIDAGTVMDESRWICLMNLRSVARGDGIRLRLGGGHRALGDVRAARDVLLAIAAGIAV